MNDNDGRGEALDASVEANDNADVVEQEDPKIALRGHVEAAQARVDKLEGHLAGAKEALADAKRALKEAD